ncbi:hypothetical protein BASA50_003676 [Batrachochytrium salamandrivorans]|uniref:Rho termination factor N-terminal domain-containing protein n=1 Tax=Batrachochytrium salamandrivorans TaxID=1357716 RepID=A0ABQ8FIC3_9FUNG|nr:hypothetical protein BASA50_003676 [Batrachochytrium salamandrivorans]KAH9266749.1 hypothetical protein BASA84_001001 [Batrachochytrium salamandrivorans]
MDTSTPDFDSFTRADALLMLKDAGISGYGKKKRIDVINALKEHIDSIGKLNMSTASCSLPLSSDNNPQSTDDLDDDISEPDGTGSPENIVNTTYDGEGFEDEDITSSVIDLDGQQQMTGDIMEHTEILDELEAHTDDISIINECHGSSTQALISNALVKDKVADFTLEESSVVDFSSNHPVITATLDDMDKERTNNDPPMMVSMLQVEVDRSLAESPISTDVDEPESVADWLKRHNLVSLLPTFEKEELLDWDVVKDITLPSLQTLSLPLGAMLKFMKALHEKFDKPIPDNKLAPACNRTNEDIESLVTRLVDARLVGATRVASARSTISATRAVPARQPISRMTANVASSSRIKEKDATGGSEQAVASSSTGLLASKKTRNLGTALSASARVVTKHSSSGAKSFPDPDTRGQPSISRPTAGPHASTSLSTGSPKTSFSRSTNASLPTIDGGASVKSSIPSINKRPFISRAIGVEDTTKKVSLRSSKSTSHLGLSRKNSVSTSIGTATTAPAAESSDTRTYSSETPKSLQKTVVSRKSAVFHSSSKSDMPLGHHSTLKPSTSTPLKLN